MNENRNLAMAVVFSVLILLGFQLYNEWRYTDDDNPQPSQTVEQAEPATDAQVPTATTPSSTAQAPDGTVAGVRDAVLKGRDAMLAESPRILVRAPRLEGSLALRGGRLDDLTMIDYRETLEADSKRIVLLSPSGAKDAYFADFGWVGNGLKMPDSNTLWAANRKTLTPETPVTLSWDNGQGLTFQRTMAIDENYMFTVTQTVKNNGSSAVTLFPYGLVSRHGSPQVTGFYILHEGLLGVFDETLLEVDYDELQEDNLQIGRAHV